MTTTSIPRPSWDVGPRPVHAADSAALLRAYFIEVSDRYYQVHHGRRSTDEEIESGLIEHHSDDLVPPHAVFLLGRYGRRPAEPAGCAGVRLLDAATAELKRLYVRPALRGTGGGAALLTAAHAAARELGAERIILDTRHDLVEARALYARHGYGETSRYNDDPYAERWFTKQLV
ncbi:GNAT family N-acetyltransferase [Streptomyces zagrosensis]|uniref:GNAT superfamily N-acetyltransferase n=1 Tax=Streptomyces zagrosensis TaxID=1042984 RepID=A0A7W9Q4U2_9ACTN|nr:GNAT family N-acetyltransferase [Streptomyces zagrosensis]MBB5933223.1 GNAT superfamily N-acetyltransferase [Streptomyces zagrosensis]